MTPLLLIFFLLCETFSPSFCKSLHFFDFFTKTTKGMEGWLIESCLPETCLCVTNNTLWEALSL